MKDWVQQRLSSGPHDPDQVNAVLMEAAATYFPRSRSEGKPESAQHRATLRMWHRVQQIRSLHEESVTTLADLEQSLEDLSTWHKQALNLARKERHRAFQAEVDEACAHHDSYIAHKTLKKLRPWTPQVKAQLQGQMATCWMHQLSCNSFATTWRRSLRSTLPLSMLSPPFPSSLSDCCPNTSDRFVRTRQCHKALPLQLLGDSARIWWAKH